MNIVSPDPIDKWLSIIEKITILAAAVVAAIKLKVFGQWDEDYRTELESNCREGGRLVWAHYTIANIGDRPFEVECARLDLCPIVEQIGGHLVPDPDKEKALVPATFMARSKEVARSFGFDPTKHHFKELQKLGYLGKGERTIFTLRCRSKEQLPQVFFVVAEWWRHSRFGKQHKHSSFTHLHVHTTAEDFPLARSASGLR